MLEDLYRGSEQPIDDLEYVKGCPACDRTDPELERELRAFARLFFDIYLEAHGQQSTDKAAPR
ncbi:MAG TPA: hypothetical protein VNJ52_14620 [Patescibacteria group bacterium]|nr:hypothetical protein [Patescibacteria group bacterium]